VEKNNLKKAGVIAVSVQATLASRGLEEPAHASRGLEEPFFQFGFRWGGTNSYFKYEFVLHTPAGLAWLS
jgi:hypothetical protein